MTQFFLKTFRIICLLTVVCLGLVTIIGTGGGSSSNNGSSGDPIDDATMNDFVGTWAGNIEFTSDTESFTEPITLNVSIEGDNLVGMLVFDDGESDILTGTVSNGMWHFDIISSDPSDPDCANWDVSGISELFDDFNEMEISASGTFCGAGGGQQGSFVGTLYR